MKKYSSAIKHLRQKIKALADEGIGIRQHIHMLTWKDTDEALVARRTVQAARKAGGRQTLGKRFLKPHRRPETGNQRYALWNDKRRVGWDARHAILAMGLLKERPYLTMESKCDTTPSCAVILDLIHEALGEDEALKAEWTHQRIVDLILVAGAKKEAA